MKNDKILWADDEIDLLKPYVIYLAEKGYDVVTVTNGRDAIDQFRAQAFDIVFLDENMPGLNGLETLAAIKEINAAVPVVMITKSEEENIMDMAIGSKIADYLIKPVNPTQILLTLKKHIHKKDIVNEHTTTSYRMEFMQIGNMITSANSMEEWMEIQKKLVFWEMELQAADNSMLEMLQMQKAEANNYFCKYIKRVYEGWFAQPEGRPTLSPDLLSSTISVMTSGRPFNRF